MIKYSLLSFNAMPFNRKLKYDWGGYFVGIRDKEGILIKKLSKYSFDIKSTIKIQYDVASYFENHLCFYHTTDQEIKKLDIGTFEVSRIKGSRFPQFKWENFVGYYNIGTKKYEVLDEKCNKIFEFKFQFPIITKLIESGILLYQNNEKENNWIKCLDPNGGREKWEVSFPWQFVRLETFKNFIVISYQAYDNIRTDKGYEGERNWYNPNRFTIVLDGATGKELWRYSNSYHSLDIEHEVVLTGRVNDSQNGKVKSLSVIELDIHTGESMTEIEVKPVIEQGFNICFVDNEGIYYKIRQGSFGKISKVNGKIIWEFDLIDSKGEKRKLSDWLLLGNGNLVLQAAPNHPNGDLTCIFDPRENMKYANILNGQKMNG